MGFALWVDGETAWAAGTHEYRPMGVAVIASSDLFRTRDFDPRRPPKPEPERDFAGFFASVGDVNDYLKSRRYTLAEDERKTEHIDHYRGIIPGP
jgi:hypothetical protein